jgi:putative transposase
VWGIVRDPVWRVKTRPTAISYTLLRRRLIVGWINVTHPVFMSNYRRVWVPGGTYFFTVNLLRRDQSLLVDHLGSLRTSFRAARAVRPFDIVAMVVLPEQLHCIWQLPEGDADNATRWRHIKATFSRRLPCTEWRSARRLAKQERGIWQRRFWERLMRDERDLCAHVDYIHFNPVKHGLVARVRDWPHSTFHRYVRDGRLAVGWGRAGLGPPG